MITAGDLKVGDEFRNYEGRVVMTVEEDAYPLKDGRVLVYVRWNDGGVTPRVFDHWDTQTGYVRPEATS